MYDMGEECRGLFDVVEKGGVSFGRMVVTMGLVG